MDPLSIIASTIAIIGAVKETYDVVNKISNLPDAFKEVEKQLPVVEKTLRLAKSRLRREPDPTDEEDKAIAEIVKTSQDKVTKLKEVFQKFEKECKADAEAKSWAKIRSVYRGVVAGQKAHRVETLMQDILKSTKNLALHQIFEAATREDLGKIEEAIASMSQVQPSLEDSEFDRVGISAVMNIGDHGQGQQNNASGDYHTFNSGENLATGSGHIIYFGATIIHNHTSQSTDDLGASAHGHGFSNLPLIHVSYFVGRDDLLENIRQTFTQCQQNPKTTTPAVAVLTGIGGQGKSQTALRYCYLTRGYYAKFWINATSRETTLRSFERIAAEMSREDARILQGLGIVSRLVTWEMVVEELARWEAQWLLVFDNYDDPDHFSGPEIPEGERFSRLRDFFPPSSRGSIIITTRDRRVGLGDPHWKRHDVSAMTESEALSLLRQFSPDGELQNDELEAGKEIVEMLGYFPLAISQSAWFVAKYAKGFREYLERFNEFKKAAIKKMPEGILWHY